MLGKKIQNIYTEFWKRQDWGGGYVGLTLDWDYNNKEVHLSMLGYVQKAFMRFNHQQLQKPQHRNILILCLSSLTLCLSSQQHNANPP